MKTRFAPTVLVLSLITAVSASAFAFGGGDKMPQPDRQAFRQAVLSGALTDSELATLKQERHSAMTTIKQLRADGDFSQADREQASKLMQALNDKTRALIDNAERGPKRDKMPEGLTGMHGKHAKDGHGGKHDDKSRPARGGMGNQAEMKAFRDAVISGALTDAELATLKAEHDKLRQADKPRGQRPDMTALQQLTRSLIDNQDRTQPRTSWPDELAPWHGRMHR